MTPSELRVRRVSHRGQVAEWTLQSALGAARRETGDPEFGIERLYLVSRGRRFPVGRFLGRTKRQALPMALTAALHDRQTRPDLQSGRPD